jgi:hypothetical protein
VKEPMGGDIIWIRCHSRHSQMRLHDSLSTITFLGHSLLSLQTLGQKSCETKDAHVQKGSSYLIFSR